MIGYKLDIQQAELIRGKFFNSSTTFNPVLDIDGVYFIFEGEVENCVNEEFMWVKDLPTAEYIPSTSEQSLIK